MLGIQATAISRADTPWSNLLATNRVEADPAKPYTLKEEHGPWIIMACSFNGENAQKQAHDLVLELRKRYRMEAFVHRMEFELDDPNGNVQPIFASPHRHQYQMVTRKSQGLPRRGDQGNRRGRGQFPRDRRSRRPAGPAKTEVGRSRVPPFQPETQSRSLAVWRSLQASVTDLPQYIEGRKQTGPLAHAFITRNPLLPEDYFAPKGGVDELVLKMNKNVKHSLLDCPGKYTVQVAHFTGEVIINQNEIRAIETGAKAGPGIDQARPGRRRRKGPRTDRSLADQGLGGLRVPRSQRQPGHGGQLRVRRHAAPGRQDRNQPAGPSNHRGFSRKPLNVTGGPGAMQPQSLVGIFFDVQPIPVEVPKRSISRQLTQRLDMAGQSTSTD